MNVKEDAVTNSIIEIKSRHCLVELPMFVASSFAHRAAQRIARPVFSLQLSLRRAECGFAQWSVKIRHGSEDHPDYEAAWGVRSFIS